MSTQWSEIIIPQTVNLQHIMSEELAKDLGAEKNKNIVLDHTKEHYGCVQLLEEKKLQKSDEEIVRMLPELFNKEYECMVQCSENSSGSNSKVSITFSNHRRTPSLDMDNENDDEELEILDNKNRSSNSIRGRKNEFKIMSLLPEFDANEIPGFNIDIDIGNKNWSSITEKRKRFKKQILHLGCYNGNGSYTDIAKIRQVVNRIAGGLVKVEDVISIGKRSTIFSAKTNYFDYYWRDMSRECIVKVFKTTRNMELDNAGILFTYKMKRKREKTNLIQSSAENEFLILERLNKVGLRCPKVLAAQGPVLIMSHIGTSNNPAPTLNHANLTRTQLRRAYKQTVSQMKAVYTICNLIHTTLSEHTILWNDKKCYFISFGQAVELSHHGAFDYLYKDCSSISRFFSKQLANVSCASKLFKNITGCDYDDKSALIKLQVSFRNKSRSPTGKK